MQLNLFVPSSEELFADAMKATSKIPRPATVRCGKLRTRAPDSYLQHHPGRCCGKAGTFS